MVPLSLTFVITIQLLYSFSAGLDIIECNEIKCTNRCATKKLTEKFNCSFTSVIYLNGTKSNLYITFLLKREADRTAEEIFSLEPHSDCKKFTNKIPYSCHYVTDNVVSISVHVNASIENSEAEITCKAQVPGLDVIERKSQRMPKVLDSTTIEGVLNINGQNMSSESCFVDLPDGNLTLDFQCLNIGEHCVIEVELNDSNNVASDIDRLIYKRIIMNDAFVLIKFAPCNLNEFINALNCSIKIGLNTMTSSSDENNNITVILSCVFGVIFIIGIIAFLIFKRRQKRENLQRSTENPDEGNESLMEESFINTSENPGMIAPRTLAFQEMEHSDEISYEIEKENTNLQVLYDECAKEPGHTNFIKLNTFSVQNLPSGYQNDDFLKLVKCMARLTVHLTVEKISGNRKSNKYGTGFVESIVQYLPADGNLCKCKQCKEKPYKSKNWRSMTVYTSLGLVISQDEAQKTKCRFFYDSEGSKLCVIEGFEIEILGVKCKLTFYTCNKKLFYIFEKLLKSGNNWSKLNRCINEKYENKNTDAKFTCIVSHIHGLPKVVSFGDWDERVVEWHGGSKFTKYTYKTPTCPGSAGAYVFIIGRDHPGVVHHHMHRGVDGNGNNWCDLALDWCS